MNINQIIKFIVNSDQVSMQLLQMTLEEASHHAYPYVMLGSMERQNLPTKY
jgi:hypothetical protein